MKRATKNVQKRTYMAFVKICDSWNLVNSIIWMLVVTNGIEGI